MDNRHLARIVAAADIIILCRACYNHVVDELVTLARRANKPLLFDVDDLVFDVEQIDLLIDTIDEPYSDESIWDKWFAYVGRVARSLRLCDRAIVTNARLAEALHECSGLHASVVPNFLNAEQMDISRRIMAEKRATGFQRDGLIHVGYFSGSPTHMKDFGCVADALLDLLRTDRRVVLRTAGYLEPERWFGAFSERLDHHKMQDYVGLQQLIGTTEINLIPLQDNLFTNCKSELKFFEAAAVGTISIASPTFVHRNVIEDGADGFLSFGHMWQDCLDKVIDLLDRDGYATIADQASVKAERLYSPERQLSAVRAALFPCVAPSEDRSFQSLDVSGRR